jgi:hypothetical protein
LDKLAALELLAAPGRAACRTSPPWEVAYDAEAGNPRALKGLSEMLNQVTTLRRENTELIARVRELEARTVASSSSPSHPSADGERPSP